MEKFFTKLASFVTAFALAFGLFGFLPASSVVAAEITVAPDSSLRDAISAASDGDILQLETGTYEVSGELAIDKEITIVGAGEDQTIIKISSTGYGVFWTANNVSLENLTVDGSEIGTFGLKIQAAPGSTEALTGVNLTNVTVQGSGRTEIDLHFVDGATLTNVTADGLDSEGVGVAMTGSTNVTLTNVITRGNTWGGVAVFTNPSTAYSVAPESGNITISNLSAEEPNKLYSQGVNGGVVTELTATQFTHTVKNSEHRTNGSEFTFYQHSESDAINFALALSNPTASLVQNATSDFIVGEGMSIQSAVNAASDNANIFVRAGVYTENVLVNKSGITLEGAGSGVTKLASVKTAGNIMVIDGFTLSGFELAPTSGLAFLALSGTPNGTSWNKNFTLSDILADGAGIGLMATEGANLQNIILKNVTSATAGAVELVGVSNFTLSESEFSGNVIGIHLMATDAGPGLGYGINGPVTIEKTSFSNNTEFAVKNGDSTVVIDAQGNYWGSETGPTHSSNPTGSGDMVTDNVNFGEFCTSNTCIVEDDIEEQPTRRSSGGSRRVVDNTPTGEVAGAETGPEGEVLGAAVYNFTRDLTIGSTGDDVTALQTMLIASGDLEILVPTGYFGELTKAALIKWQARNGVPATGYFGPLTRAAITAAGTPAPAMTDAQRTAMIAELLKKVLELQEKINNL